MKTILIVLITIQILLIIWYSIKISNDTIDTVDAVMMGINIMGVFMNLLNLSQE